MKALLLVLALVVAGCSAPRTDNVGDYVAVSTASVEAMANTVGQLQKEGSITEAEEDGYLNQLESILASIRLAHGSAINGDNKTALEIMREVNKALFILQKELEAEQ